MIFSIIILLLVGLIAFFHYVQGFFSATLSAIFAVIAAVLSVSYHETVVNSLLKGKVSDEADGMVLCVLFAAVYIILRLIFDAAVPGNLRFPPLADKIGSAVMGIIAGIFSTGIFALAAQALPFGPAVGMYSRFPLKDTQEVAVPTDRQQKDSVIYDELDGENLDIAKEKSLLIPVDDVLLATVQRASDGGALAGAQPFGLTHPDYPQELFGNRLGIQLGGKHTALNLNGVQQVQLMDVFSVPALATSDPEFSTLRKGRKIDPIVKPKSASQLLLIVRLKVDHAAGDDIDGLFRFSTGSIRLVANGKNYYPIGTVDNATVLYLQKPDDFMFLDLKTNTEAGIDAAFLVDKSDVLASAGKAQPGAQTTIDDGIFIEVKRLAQIDLSGKSVSTSYSASPTVAIMRKRLELESNRKPPVPLAMAPSAAAVSSPAASGTNTPAPAATAKLPVVAKSLKAGTKISHKIGVSTSDVDAQNIAVPGGTVSLKDSKLAKVTIDPTETLAKLATGDNQLSDLYVPAGKQMVQLNSTRPGTDPWSWIGDLGSLELIDAGNNHYSPNGFATVVTDGEKTSLLMHYDADQPVTSATPGSGKAGVVTYMFLVPAGTQVKQISVGGVQGDVDLTVP